MDLSKLRDGRVHFRESSVKGLVERMLILGEKIITTQEMYFIERMYIYSEAVPIPTPGPQNPAATSLKKPTSVQYELNLIEHTHTHTHTLTHTHSHTHTHTHTYTHASRTKGKYFLTSSILDLVDCI